MIPRIQPDPIPNQQPQTYQVSKELTENWSFSITNTNQLPGKQFGKLRHRSLRSDIDVGYKHLTEDMMG